ncbi:MAG: hypothetical protein IJ849_09655 [Selenomonadaceae bacterium]|nr:hypothetical protein [Selenomonadaceae bacterium]
MEYCKIHPNDSTTLIVGIVRLWESEERGSNMEVRIEKEGDMDTYAEFTLPAYHCHHAYGFKETDIMRLEKFLRDNAVTLWRMGRGEIIAESVA